MDEIGLAERLHELPHVKVYGPVIPTAGGTIRPFDLRRLNTKFEIAVEEVAIDRKRREREATYGF